MHMWVCGCGAFNQSAGAADCRNLPQPQHRRARAPPAGQVHTRRACQVHTRHDLFTHSHRTLVSWPTPGPQSCSSRQAGKWGAMRQGHERALARGKKKCSRGPKGHRHALAATAPGCHRQRCHRAARAPHKHAAVIHKSKVDGLHLRGNPRGGWLPPMSRGGGVHGQTTSSSSTTTTTP